MNADQPVANYCESLVYRLHRVALKAPPLGIRANPNLGPTGFVNGINSAILRYAGAPTEEPPSPSFASKTPLNEAQLIVGVNPSS